MDPLLIAGLTIDGSSKERPVGSSAQRGFPYWAPIGCPRFAVFVAGPFGRNADDQRPCFGPRPGPWLRQYPFLGSLCSLGFDEESMTKLDALNEGYGMSLQADSGNSTKYSRNLSGVHISMALASGHVSCRSRSRRKAAVVYACKLDAGPL